MNTQETTYSQGGYSGESAETLSLKGLSPAPGQVWGAVRLVPLIRDKVREDLRIQMQRHASPHQQVVVQGRKDVPKLTYTSYIPHGLIVSHGDGAGDVHVSWQTALGKKANTSRGSTQFCKANRLHRMVKRIGPSSVRMLPMHMALEGFLALHFGGPDIAYDYYSKRSLRFGLTPRVEYGITGLTIPELGEALSRFEIHPGQCGMLIYVADALASAFVVSHPDDYRRLHSSVLSDMYAELFWYYGMQYDGVQTFGLKLDAQRVQDMESLRAEYARARGELGEFEAMVMGAELIERAVRFDKLYGMKRFELQRFITDFGEFNEPVNHIGERIVRADGTLEYLKTFRLSAQQVQKARLLDLLARHQWDLKAASWASGRPMWQLKDDIIKTGFGYILKHGAATKLP
jgi:hypothetical protein